MTAVALSSARELLPLEPRCRCPGGTRRLPLRIDTAGLHALIQATAGVEVAPELVLLTYRCYDCKAVVRITLRDLYLTS